MAACGVRGKGGAMPGGWNGASPGSLAATRRGLCTASGIAHQLRSARPRGSATKGFIDMKLYDPASDCPLAGALAERLRQSRDELTSHWLERIAARVSLPATEVFPTDDLLDHVPLLIDGIADYLEAPAAEITTDMPVIAKAIELGALRHAQGFDVYEILKEYEILGGILFNFLAYVADELPEDCQKSELLACGQRLFRALTVIQQATTTHFLRLVQGQVTEREDRLRAFNRAVSHEIKNRIGTVLGAGEVLREVPTMSRDERGRFVDIITRNARAMQAAVANVLAVARTDADSRQQRHVRLPEAAREAARQVRDAAQAARVAIHLAPDIVDVEVNAAAVELCLTNYLSNAIKYADPAESQRVAMISARLEQSADGDPEVVVRVSDNGLGVPAEVRDRLFERFFRAHETITDAEGTGLGLSIVRDTTASLGGRAWAEFPEKGAVFAFSLPERRSADRRAEAMEGPAAAHA
jgi:signal transduction histidine kinase